jgi:hypothetical protein
VSESKFDDILCCSSSYKVKDSNTAGLSSTARLSLRSQRHDIAGRVQTVWGSVELLDSPYPDLPEEILEAIRFLKDTVKAWRGELLVLDLLLDGTPNVTGATTDQIRKVLSSNLTLPEIYWHCEPEGLYASIRHAYKTVGHTGYHELHMNVEAENHLIIEIQAGESTEHSLQGVNDTSTNRNVTEVFAGDIDAAFAEAHAYLAGISIAGFYTDLGAGIRFVICPA